MPSTSEYIRNLDPNKPGFQAPGFSWEDYIEHRPVYHSSAYERIYNYHASHSSSWAVAHDAGAGAGIASEVLAKKFNHVHVSDPGPGYIQVAEKRLKSLGFPRGKFSFHGEGAESSSVASDSVDLLLIAEAIHWCDIPLAMKEFARQVKPGGTVAVTQYGPPTFRNRRASKIWRNIFRHYMIEEINLGGVFERAIINSGSAMDTVPFDTQYYEPGAKRIYLNTGGDLGLLSLLPVPGPDRTLVTDEKIFIENDKDWTQEADTEFLRGIFASFMTGIKDDELDEFWPELEEALGGKGARFELIWPNCQLLATRSFR